MLHMFIPVWTILDVMICVMLVTQSSGLTLPLRSRHNSSVSVNTTEETEKSYLSNRSTPDDTYRAEVEHIEDGVGNGYGWTVTYGTNHTFSIIFHNKGYRLSYRNWSPNRIMFQSHDPCLQSDCGPHSMCRNKEGEAECSCLPDFSGTPPDCRQQCEFDTQCPRDKSCFDGKCEDPCKTKCGNYSECIVIDHVPRCFCLPDKFKDPHRCRPPCQDNDDCQSDRTCVAGVCVNCVKNCGRFQKCSVVNHRQECVCLSNSNCLTPIRNLIHCSLDSFRLDEECDKLCSPVCEGGSCIIMHHNPVCIRCPPGYPGIPPNCGCKDKDNCLINYTCADGKCIDPCLELCGNFAECDVINNNLTCVRCLPDYFGTPPHCKSQCEANDECPSDKICADGDCVDPCPDMCGNNSYCTVVKHVPICYCPPDNYKESALCTLLCSVNTDCQSSRTCVEGICVNLCPGACGENEECSVIDHSPVCTCLPGSIGTPPNCRLECNNECQSDHACINEKCVDLCAEECGENAYCKVNDGIPECNGCKPYHFGAPPNCRSRCEDNDECLVEETCINGKCVDLCAEECGENAYCKVNDGIQECNGCKPYNFGDPPNCRPACEGDNECLVEETCIDGECVDPCPQKCGDHAFCHVDDHIPKCDRCKLNYFGTPPNCEPGCEDNDDCSSDLTCVVGKCVDSCQGYCGFAKYCDVVDHIPICFCPPDYIGKPPNCTPRCVNNNDCIIDTICVNGQCVSPCFEKCGEYSICNMTDHIPSCFGCENNYNGTPPNCGLSCSGNDECPVDRACLDGKCIDPCPEKCGDHAFCSVSDHIPMCIGSHIFCFGEPETCQLGCKNDFNCGPHTVCVDRKCIDPCKVECAENAQCVVHNHKATCYCTVFDPYTGIKRFQTNCRLRCKNNDECQLHHACIDGKCVNPCPSTCGDHTVCYADNHFPRCACLPSYFGIPPNCSSECKQNSECPLDRTCVDGKCIDTCPEVCGNNAECYVVEHIPRCVQCLPDYYGTPPNCSRQCGDTPECPVDNICLEGECVYPCEAKCGDYPYCDLVGNSATCLRCFPNELEIPPRCDPICQVDDECLSDRICLEGQCVDPCPEKCGDHSLCVLLNRVPQCIKCLPDYLGVPPNCRPGCYVNGDCSSNKICVNGKCVNPCEEKCGFRASCEIINYVATCLGCPEDHGGTPPYCYPTPAYRPTSLPKVPEMRKIEIVKNKKVEGGLTSTRRRKR